MERFKQVSRSERASALQRQTFCFRIRALWAWSARRSCGGGSTSQYVSIYMTRIVQPKPYRGEMQGEKKPHSHTHTRARTHTGGQTSGRRILPGVAGTASIVASSVLAAANGILSSGARLRIGTLLIHRQGQGQRSNSSVFSIHRTERKESNTHTTTGMRQWTAI
jgi:hypothetical protein